MPLYVVYAILMPICRRHVAAVADFHIYAISLITIFFHIMMMRHFRLYASMMLSPCLPMPLSLLIRRLHYYRMPLLLLSLIFRLFSPPPATLMLRGHA